MPNQSTERLFFALWPNDNVRQAINEATQPIIQTTDGKIIPFENWHITLAFLGDVNMPIKQCVQQIAATVQGSRFSLSLDQMGHWSKSRILWLGVQQAPDSLQNLVNNLQNGLLSCDYRPDSRPFQIHLTLMRKAGRVNTLPAIKPIIWLVEDFCLVRSNLEDGGARYEVIARWELLESNL